MLAIDYRGFGDSTGGPPTAHTLALDAYAAIKWLEARGVPPGRVLLYGHSLGTGAAAQVALRLEAEGSPPFGAVLEAPFYSLRAGALTFPATLPLLALPGTHALLMRCFMNGCRTADALALLPALPVLLLHGDSDTTVPINHSIALRDMALNGPAAHKRTAPFRLEVLHGCDHLHALVYPQTLLALSTFMREVAGEVHAAAKSKRNRK